MQIHYNSNTTPDRYPEWVAEQDSIQANCLCTERLGFGEMRVPGKVRIRRTQAGAQAANTY